MECRSIWLMNSYSPVAHQVRVDEFLQPPHSDLCLFGSDAASVIRELLPRGREPQRGQQRSLPSLLLLLLLLLLLRLLLLLLFLIRGFSSWTFQKG